MTERRAMQPKGNAVRRTSFTGIFLGLAALVACELPIVLALIGFGALGTATTTLQPPFWMEVASMVVILLGVFALIGLAIRQKRFNEKAKVK